MKTIDQLLDEHGISQNQLERDRYLNCLLNQTEYHPVYLDLISLYPYDRVMNCPSIRVLEQVGIDKGDPYIIIVDGILDNFPGIRTFLEECDSQFKFEWKFLERVNPYTMTPLYDVYLSMPAEHLVLYRICS
ncbi:MAG: hypothetical protein EOO61_10505 [Hymenobacter sp.]|nr:MAG: hypothetical protein EOO61_10505 [Hymenobacter sp.]